jgi:hypothetical protein
VKEFKDGRESAHEVEGGKVRTAVPFSTEFCVTPPLPLSSFSIHLMFLRWRRRYIGMYLL